MENNFDFQGTSI